MAADPLTFFQEIDMMIINAPHSIVTARIASNIAHGVKFAVDTEVKRFRRAGMGKEASISAGIAQVRSVIDQLGIRK